MSKLGSMVQLDWYLSPEGAEILKVLLQPNVYKRKQYGFLEKPNLPLHIEELNYKIFVTGKAGIGKTSTIARLAGLNPGTGYYETTGINVTGVYWPVKLIQSSKIVIFRLEFWDSGEMVQKKFNHVVPSCKEEMAATMFLFSFTDKSGLDAIPEQMSNILQMNDTVCPIIVGTRYDLHTATDVTVRDVRDFEKQFKVPVIKMKNILTEQQNKVLQKAEFSDVALALNLICEQLWIRDQQQQ